MGMRQEIQAGAIITAIQCDARIIVEDGYENCLKLFKLFGHVSCMLCFKFVSPIVFGKKLDLSVMAPLLVLPAIFCVYLPLREVTIRRHLTERNKLLSRLINHV